MKERVVRSAFFASLILLALAVAAQQQPGAPETLASSAASAAPAAAPESTAPSAPAAASSSRLSSPRLGAAAQRNENVVVYLIDTNAIKEANIRLGARATAVTSFSPESFYFAAEHGQPPSETLLLRPVAPLAGWHGEAGWQHQNSVFNARTFFQVGPVQPSRRNFSNARLTGSLPLLGALTAVWSQRDIRGMVNGNVLVPLPEERTPLATDPAVRAVVQRFLDAFPKAAPNRPDFDPRALNTNAPQRIDALTGTLRLDRALGARDQLFLSHTIDRQRIVAFQFVAGQNPDTDIHSHRARISWRRVLSPLHEFSLGASFHRNRTDLLPEPNAVGPRVRFGYAIEELGPDSYFPIERATNSFRYGGVWRKTLGGGRHQLTAGGDFTRFQLNGRETYNGRGFFQFGATAGRTSIDNLRLGLPLLYEAALGHIHRGYRNWTLQLFAGDQWKAHPRLAVSWGLRYMADSRPVEVQRLDVIAYGADANNFSPQLGLAWQAGAGWTVRAAYTTTFSQIPPVTYQQVRLNPPHVLYVMVPDPDLANPLRGVDLRPDARYSPTWLSPDLCSPYSHLYSLSLERKLAAGMLRLNYIGSRTIKLLNAYTMNRAEPVPGMPLTTANVNERRPDPRYYDTRTIVNGGIAYFDGGQAQYELPSWRGLLVSAVYTFSKAIDEGPDFATTAAARDIMQMRSQWQYDSFGDKKGLSNFDSTHSLLWNYTYEIPAPRSSPLLRALAGGWQLSGSHMWKKGTPVTLYIGSDAPGFGNVDGGPGDRPNILDPSILGRTIGHPDTAPLILSRTRFSYIQPGQHAGNLGRGTFRRAPIWNWNAAVARQVRLPNEWILQWRAEAYNLSNTPQFDEPQRNLSSPAFGRITNTLNDGRVFQFGLRFAF
ncbi:MAG: TonB-dependent receptor [Bryobacteraceae bacterium]|nr:TonB-dependent receptor [Bryobacteraceae bacterium]